MSSTPQERRRTKRRSSDPWAPTPRSRSHSLNAADTRLLHHRTVRFLLSDSEDEDGYFEDNEGSSAEDARHPIKSRERPRSATSKDSLSVVMRCSPPTHHGKPASPQGSRGKSSSVQDYRQPLRTPEQHRSQQASPLPPGQKNKKKTRSLGFLGRKFTQSTPAAAPSPSRLKQIRPSSAGPLLKHHRQKQSFRTGSSPGVFFDSAAELMSALSQEERELLETITEKGYPLHTAILALQKTGYHSPEKVCQEVMNHCFETLITYG